ncbi:MAG: MBL fold metallo-hydrolase [Candidatus Spechtbacterales bacterium]
MVISWYGQSCFKIQSGSTVVVTDPFNKSIGLNPPKAEAQLVLISHDHPDHNNIATIKGSPFVIDGPGEYDHLGIRVEGMLSYQDNKEGEDRGLNTIYSIKMDNIQICHLGYLGQHNLNDDQLERLGEVDILLIPVGGEHTIDGENAVEIINQIEPRLVIPMHYKIKGIKTKPEGVDGFLKAIGKNDASPQDKLTIKKKDLPGPEEKTEVVVLGA